MASSGVPLQQAADRFVAFFRELQEAFVERDDLLLQVALALLSRQHVLMTGPPGTAKSQLAHAVLGRIVSRDTGRSSLFARQFTESTVQTDLVGPIDFKTLMESGRTEHFTDEGILGAVHAFLDEVFDGRDMLLRSTLNLLQERELKEGTKITAGKIECALMTSNRYLAEILDNERLVAFVDRIAFLSFIPKGFATPAGLESVLCAQVAGQKPPELQARLTIEDLDLLQAAADDVYIDESVCTALAALLRRFETELAAARRADPSFVPSRYLSTRTAVRLGTILRSNCLLDWMGRDPKRPLEVLPEDLVWLRFGLTLVGPSPAQVAELLQTETDPRERRQLAIVRTEREIFDRCLEALPAKSAPARAREVARSLLDEAAPAALSQHPSSKLLSLSRALALAATSGQRGANEARDRLEATLHVIVERALRAGLGAAADDAADPVTLVGNLAALANDVERAGRQHVRAARWLRGRALTVIDQMLRLAVSPIGEALQAAQGATAELSLLVSLLDTALGRLERLRDVRDGLRDAGADEPDRPTRDAAWTAAAARLADTLAPVLRSRLATAGGEDLAALRPSQPDCAAELAALAPELHLARQAADRLARLGADGAALFAGTVTPLVAPVARRAYEGATAPTRGACLAELEQRSAALASAGVLGLLAPGDVLAWSVAGLLAVPEPVPTAAAGPADHPGYRRLREAMPAVTLSSVLVDVTLRVLPGGGQDLLDPERAVGRVGELVATLPADTRAELTRLDLAYLEAPIAYFERWRAELAAGLPADPQAATEALVRSRFFELTHDEAVLARFALEAELVGMVLGAAAVQPLTDRLAAVERESAALAARLLVARAAVAPASAPPRKPPPPPPQARRPRTRPRETP